MFRLTIATEDVHQFIHDPNHFATTWGWIKSDVLGGRLPVDYGTFNLFVVVGPESRQMRYRLYFSDRSGHPLTLAGFKDVHRNRVTALWPDTSTLYTRILNGHVEEGHEDPADLVGCGILHILPADFAVQMTTFRARGPDICAGLEGLAAFGEFFGSQLWKVYRPRVSTPRCV